MIYMLLDGWNANNVDGYGLESPPDSRPPKPDEKTHEREALEWQLRYEFKMGDDRIGEILARYDEKKQRGGE